MRYLVVLWSLWATAAGAAEVKIFRADSREAVLEGTAEGLSVDPLGTVELARRLERLSAIDEPFVFSAAAEAGGWVVGTGNSGKIVRVDSRGEASVLAAVDEPEIFAVRVEEDGSVLAGSSPHGKVYSVAAGDSEVVFDPADRYIWDLARDAEGRLLVATGLAGRLYRVDSGGGVETLYESRDSHVRSIAVQGDGSILLGTAGLGLLIRLNPQGEVTTLHDAIHPEVLDLAIAPSGKVYAALLASEASFVDLSATTTTSTGTTSAGTSSGSGTEQEEKKEQEKTGTSVSVTVQGADTVGSRSNTFSGPRSVVLEISADGRVEEIASFQSETVHSLLWHDGGLWIGTGQEGRLYRWSEDRLIQEAVLEERQIADLVAGSAGAAVITANASALYRLHSEIEAEGTYTSTVLDAAQVAAFGSFLWQGDLPPGAGMRLTFRSGMSSSPDATWTPWQAAGEVRCTGCDGAGRGAGRGREVALGDLAHGRYVQWQAKLARGRKGAGPRLASVELTYRQDNLRPKIEKLEALDPGQILVPGSFNPQHQTFEPWSPNREGIFTTLRLEQPKNGDGRLKNLWKKGYRTLRWSAEDDNSDPLTYRLDFRREAEADDWLSMVEDIDKTHYSFDATVLPDGIYRFRLTASDAEGRVASEALSDEKISESVVIDNSPPVLESRTRSESAVVVELTDALSPMRAAAVSFDAGEWRPAPAADGLLDGRRETLHIAVPGSTRLLLLRVSDAAHNVVTFDLLAEPES